MILSPKETTVAYRCPVCGEGVLAPVGVFALTADRLRLKCPCGGSSMTVTLSKTDNRVRLDLPCFACGSKHHSYTVGSELFFSREFFSLSCSMSGLDVCFFGKKEKVSDALREQEDALRDMLREDGSSGSAPDAETDRALRRIEDADIYNVILFLLTELKNDGKLRCSCGTHGDYDADCAPDGNSVRVYCKSCGKQKYFPLASVEDARRFLDLDEIVLE
ncbi:MAG: hypothetical protein IJR89_09170 [Clostridia bacterium]|nr:hypothetical protein [Clostridia bacterium]